MTSILTNAAAMSALQTLRSINNGMEDTQARVSSGLRVGGAADNAAYWSIATTMRSDNMALSAVQDALGLGAAKVDTAYAGMESSIEVVKEIKKKLVTATEDGVDKAKVQGEIAQLQDQLKGIADAASFSGENWLKADAGAAAIKDVVGSFVRDDNGNVSVKKIGYTLDDKTVLFDSTNNTPLTTYGSGILDAQAQYNGTDGVNVDITINGVASSPAVKGYSTNELLTLGLTFTTNTTTNQTVADNAGTVEYLRLDGQDKWVKLTATAPTTGQAVAYNDGSTDYFVDTADLPTNVVNADAGFSVYNLDITKLDTVATAMGGSFTEADALDFMIQYIDDQLQTMTSAAASLGSISSRIELQEEFASKLSAAIDKGVGRLVDADMNEESTRLKALQTQQQLAIQSLSIANSASQNILSLFR
ncbi:flagellin [Shinella granuli]|uniref:Flagellin n=3 Tax=Shinella granuli TaxID=323621 RepID=A0A4R2CDK6_SHIGR|nr:flagellin [Shinella granuli]TCN38601.1 flagellin [Shinella granuli]